MRLASFYAESTAFVWSCLLFIVKQRNMFLVALYFHFAVMCLFAQQFEYDKLIKVAMESPMGLGVVVAYPAILNVKLQARFLPLITQYINFAVVGNIAMMSMLPTAGLWRGHTSRVACILLTVWLLRMMKHKEFQTVSFENDLFIFNSVNLPWVYAHALYRFVMITLPSFYTLKYLLLEFNSLCMMFALAKLHGKRPTAHYFGMADTICAATFSILSTLPLYSPDDEEAMFDQVSFVVTEQQLEYFGVAAHLLVCCIAIKHMVYNL